MDSYPVHSNLYVKLSFKLTNKMKPLIYINLRIRAEELQTSHRITKFTLYE